MFDFFLCLRRSRKPVMVDRFAWLWRSARSVWTWALARAGRARRQEFFLHDPAAAGPHDLDDPFFDSKIQERVAKVIASSVRDERHKGGA